MNNKSLKTMILRALIIQTLVAFCIFPLGVKMFFAILNQLKALHYFNDTNAWHWRDLCIVTLIVIMGLTAAAVVSLDLARAIGNVLPPIAATTRSIAAGDYSARVVAPRRSFEEADALSANINTMAKCLEKLQADLRYMNSAFAHEARTCLTVLSGFLHAISTGVLEPTPDVLARMMGYANSLAAIVNDIDNLGLSGAVIVDLDIKEIDLAVEAETVISSMEYHLNAFSITIERDLSRAVCFADPMKIQQVLRALLKNCQIHAPGSTVTVQTFEEEDCVVLLCKDTGPGLPAAEWDRAFDRCWRGSASRERAPEGRGIGLAIVNSIASAHHGKPFIEPGEGFNVGIRLPKRATSVTDLNPSNSTNFS